MVYIFWNWYFKTIEPTCNFPHHCGWIFCWPCTLRQLWQLARCPVLPRLSWTVASWLSHFSAPCWTSFISGTMSLIIQIYVSAIISAFHHRFLWLLGLYILYDCICPYMTLSFCIDIPFGMEHQPISHKDLLIFI